MLWSSSEAMLTVSRASFVTEGRWSFRGQRGDSGERFDAKGSPVLVLQNNARRSQTLASMRIPTHVYIWLSSGICTTRRNAAVQNGTVCDCTACCRASHHVRDATVSELCGFSHKTTWQPLAQSDCQPACTQWGPLTGTPLRVPL